MQWWYQGHNNWNGVCNSSVAATFLLLEPELGRVARAIELAQAGLRIFLDTAFEQDGCSTEGVGYWQFQQAGPEFRGELLSVETDGPIKQVESEFARACAVVNLSSLRRQVAVAAQDETSGTVWLQDTFCFSASPVEAEEMLITWLEVDADGATAILHGQRRDLRLIIETPADARFSVERLEEQCKANAKPDVLKRLTFVLPAVTETQARVRTEIM